MVSGKSLSPLTLLQFWPLRGSSSLIDTMFCLPWGFKCFGSQSRLPLGFLCFPTGSCMSPIRPYFPVTGLILLGSRGLWKPHGGESPVWNFLSWEAVQKCAFSLCSDQSSSLKTSGQVFKWL